jgi:hypothetical protein
MMLIALVPQGLAVTVTFRQHRKRRTRSSFYLLFIWSFLFLWGFLIVLADLFLGSPLEMLSIPFKFLSTYLVIPVGFVMCLLVDTFSRDRVDPIKLIVMSGLSMAMIMSSITNPNTQIIGYRASGELSVITQGPLRIVGSLTLMFSGLLLMYTMAKVVFKAPPNLRISAWIGFVGSIIIGLGTPISYLAGLSMKLPYMTTIELALGVFLCALSFNKTPQLAYILSFKVYRLIIVNMESGISLYDYEWNRSGPLSETKPFDLTLFLGGIIGAGQIFNLTIQKGNLREVLMDKGVLLIERFPKTPIACILVSSKVAQILRDALIHFSNGVLKTYPELIEKMRTNLTNDVTQFEKLVPLIKDAFFFIP